MKVAVLGGAGVRTPLLVHGLAHSDLPLSEISLYDPDEDRLALIASVAGRLSGNTPVRICASSTFCIEGADFVFTSIRVGGIERRARDEALILQRGVLGQETIGPGGFAMAMRTIPQMVRYGREVARHAPHAWMINFTNPVGIITQAVQSETGAKIIGICDTPTELFADVARALELPSAECHFDFFGLNHLGWLREVYRNGEPQMHRLWREPARLDCIYRAPLFERAFLLKLKLLPTEYLYYYYRPNEAYENIRRAETSRGAVIQQLNARLFSDLRRADADAVRIYESYLSERNASYMSIESGTNPAAPASPWASLTGYDKSALAVVRAVHFNLGAIIPLDIRNDGNLSCLEPNDVVEVPCAVDSNGAHALNVGPEPESVRDLIIRVKEYERLTVRAALSQSAAEAHAALRSNPLVNDPVLAETLLSDLELP
jgi:6-phospho-beta-glucosidase